MPTTGEKKCIDGAEYVWTPASAAGATSDINSKLSDIIDLLNVIASKMPGASTSTFGGSGDYRSVETDILANQHNWEISLGIDARNLRIQVDQHVKIRLGSSSADQIKIDPTESPFEIKNLSTPVSSVWVETGVWHQTNVRIVAYP
jgi:hypothetical protein